MSGWSDLLVWIPAAVAVAAVMACAAPSRAGVGDFRNRGVADAKVVLDRTVLERGQPIKGRLVTPEARVRRAAPRMTVRVSDSLGRLLVERTMPVKGSFELAVPNVLAMKHTVSIATSDGCAASTEVIYMPPREWDDYICTIWQRHNPKRIPYLQEMHLTGSQWSGSSSEPPEHFIDANYRYYVETGATWVYSAYHMWMPDKEKTHYHKLTKAAFVKDRTNFRILERNPCLSNHAIRRRIQWIFTNEARMHRPYRPLYYTVSDEPGIANQAAPFDYCFSPHCKEAFRAWLKERYKTLAALNRQWGSRYATWDDVRGMTTDEVLARTDGNFSAWCDHKDFMDSVLIDGYALAKKFIRKHDPAGRIGMGGGQGPAAVGGWDFWKFAQVFDVMENYYIGNNYELMRSFAPKMIPFHASFQPGNPEKHLIWYLFIHGDGGLLVWDDKSRYVKDGGTYSARAKEARTWYRELTGGIGKLRMASRRTDDPVALYHSQSSLRVHWVLEVRPQGKNWIRRDSWTERINSRYFRLRESWVKLIEDNGFQYRFLCPPQVDRGDLEFFNARSGKGFKVLLLPEILAMSDAEAQAIRAFVKAGGTIVADRMPGTYDEHGKRRKASPLAGLFADGADGRAILLDRDMLPYYQQRILPGSREEKLKSLVGDLLRKSVAAHRVTPDVVGADGKCVTGVETTVWRNGRGELIALHRNPLLRVHELGPQKYKSNKKFETPVRLTVRRAKPACWYDVRKGGKVGEGKEIKVTLPPFEPVFLAALPAEATPFAAEVKAGSLRITPGAPAG
ncbi:MAG: beta-galactosidase, partial [Planctomycetota bacterium]